MVPVKKEKGFNQTQLKQIAEVVLAIIKEVVPPMIDKALEEKVMPTLNKIMQCPTIAKELKELENNKSF